MQFRLFIVALCFLSASLKAQPVFDVFQFQYQYSNPTKLLNKPEGQDAVLNFFQSQLNLPVKISPRDVLVLLWCEDDEWDVPRIRTVLMWMV